ncbi:MAG: hypothetical protein H6825_09165 [Planctomycetes bacterium]|nr:hypothetical protein [Planctomycetota bacterium]
MVELLGLRIGGLSVGGVQTCLTVPRWRLAFDVGRCPEASVGCSTILFTHSHMDHMGGVASHCATRALRHMPPPVYVVPREDERAFADLFDVWRRLDRSDLPHTLVPLGIGDEHVLPNGMVVRPFRSPHRILCQGYAVSSRKKKLRDEYVGLEVAEVRRLAVDEGRDVTRVVETPELAFSGDARIEVLEHEVVRTARRLILECTFLDERVSVEQARDKGHVHLDEVLERAHLLENEAILLSHVSPRYRRGEVRRILDARLPVGLRERVQPMLAGLPV